jgi:hypothetical protein
VNAPRPPLDADGGAPDTVTKASASYADGGAPHPHVNAPRRPGPAKPPPPNALPPSGQ